MDTLQSNQVTQYGVWLPGEGWLQTPGTHLAFADTNYKVAVSAARLTGGIVMPINQWLSEYESLILERQAVMRGGRWERRLMRWMRKTWHTFHR